VQHIREAEQAIGSLLNRGAPLLAADAIGSEQSLLSTYMRILATLANHRYDVLAEMARLRRGDGPG
jgi:hypothetical protein